MPFASSEPVAVGAAVVGTTQALLAVLLGFDVVHWTSSQVALVLALVTALAGLVAVVVRSRVTPVASE